VLLLHLFGLRNLSLRSITCIGDGDGGLYSRLVVGIVSMREGGFVTGVGLIGRRLVGVGGAINLSLMLFQRSRGCIMTTITIIYFIVILTM